MNNRALKPTLTVANLFKNHSDRILRKMLLDTKRGWSGAEMAEELNISPAWAARTLATLEFEKFAVFVGKKPKGRYLLINKTKLIARWKLSYHIDFNEHYSYRVVGKEPVSLIANEAKKQGFRYAITGEVSNALIKGKKTNETPFIYVLPNKTTKVFLNELEDCLDIIPTHKKPNLILLIPYSGEGVFEGTRMVKNLWCVSDLQLKLDKGG